jgi:Type II secretion system (T2SS), protein G
MRLLFWVIGGPAIVAISFFGTLYVLDYQNGKSRNLQRAEHAGLLKNALEQYRASRGIYPSFANNPVSDLKPALVNGGYLRSIPSDPLWPDKPYRYTSGANDGKSYGLLFPIEESDQPTCVTGLMINPGWWSGPKKCPF